MGSTTSDKEMITMAEEELYRLQRQLRIMEDDRVAFSEESRCELEKQRRIIQTLKNEKEKILKDITVANCANQRRKDERLTRQIDRLLEDYERYVRWVKDEKEQMKELEVQIKKIEDDVRKLRPKSSVTDEEYRRRVTSGQNAVRILQGRLDNVVKKFCGILTDNKVLREEIDHLLKEMNQFNVVWEKKVRDLNAGKKFMADLIEQATTAFDQREEWCSKLEALKKRAENDYIAHAEEMREIQRQLDHDLTLREFLSVKGQRRVLKDLEEKERRRREQEAENLATQLRVYQETLEQIKKFCEEDDTQRIASQFLKQEEENFALFNYVNELNYEIETLTATIREMQQTIEEQMELSEIRAQERQATLKTLEADLEEAQKQANKDEEEVKNTENVLNDVLNGIDGLFDLLNCNRGPILELLGQSSNINLFNVKIYLGTIERRISSIITKVYFAEKEMLTKTKNFKTEDSVQLIN